MLEAVFANVLEISIVTGIIIMLIAKCFPKLQKRYTVRFRKVLWMILAVRLLIPYNYTLPNTPIRLFDTSKVVVHDGFSISLEEKGDGKTEDVVNVEKSDNAASDEAVETENSDSVDNSSETAVPSSESGALKVPLLAWVAVLWAVGAFISIRKDYIHYNYFLRHCEDSTEVEEGYLYEILKRVCGEIGLREVPQLFCVPEVESPMILGMLTPYMVIPDRDFSEEEWKMAFLHECTHYKKHDILYKRVIAFAASMYWFHPAVRYMKKIAFRDVELVCDRTVVEHMDKEEKRTYGNMLLKVAERSGKEVDWSSAFFGSKEVLRERIENVFDRGKKKRGIIPAAVVLALMVSGSLVFACGNPPDVKAPESIIAEERGVRLTVLDAAGSDYGFYIKMQVDIPRAYILTGSAKFQEVKAGTTSMESMGSVPVVAENECQGILWINYQGGNYRNWKDECINLSLDELVLDRSKSIDVQLDLTIDFAKFQKQADADKGNNSEDGKDTAAERFPEWFQAELKKDAERNSETLSRNDLRCYIYQGNVEDEKLWFNGNDIDYFDWEQQKIVLKESSGIEKNIKDMMAVLFLGEHQIFASVCKEEEAIGTVCLEENDGAVAIVLPNDLKAESGFFYDYLKEKGLLKK